MQSFLTKGLTQTASLWSDVKLGYAWVHRAAHILTNDEKQTAAGVRHTYEDLLTEMEQAPISSEALATIQSTFRKVTTSYWPGVERLESTWAERRSIGPGFKCVAGGRKLSADSASR